MIVTITTHEKTPVGSIRVGRQMQDSHPGRSPYAGLGQGIDWQKIAVIGGVVVVALIILRLLFRRRRKTSAPRAQLLIM